MHIWVVFMYGKRAKTTRELKNQTKPFPFRLPARLLVHPSLSSFSYIASFIFIICAALCAVVYLHFNGPH